MHLEQFQECCVCYHSYLSQEQHYFPSNFSDKASDYCTVPTCNVTSLQVLSLKVFLCLSVSMAQRHLRVKMGKFLTEVVFTPLQWLRLEWWPVQQDSRLNGKQMVLRKLISLLVLGLWSPLSPQAVSAFIKMWWYRLYQPLAAPRFLWSWPFRWAPVEPVVLASLSIWRELFWQERHFDCES